MNFSSHKHLTFLKGVSSITVRGKAVGFLERGVHALWFLNMKRQDEASHLFNFEREKSGERTTVYSYYNTTDYRCAAIMKIMIILTHPDVFYSLF